MTISPSVREAVILRAGGLCEICKGPGDWRKLSFHEEPPRSQMGRRHIYTANEVFLLCYPCHETRLGKRGLKI